MVEIRKTGLFANWLNNLRDIQAKAASLSGLNVLLQEMQVTSNLWAKVSRKCESIMVLVIVFISSNAAAS